LSFGENPQKPYLARSWRNGSSEFKRKTLNLRLVGQEGHVDLLQCLHKLGNSGFPDLSKETIWTIYEAGKRKTFRKGYFEP
jgi:hypothetical protein